MLANRTNLAKFLLLVVAAIWGSTFFIIREAVTTISPAVLLSFRFLITAIILAIVVLFQRKALFQNWKQGLVLGFLMSITLLTQSWGLQFTTAANSGFITGLMIVFVPIYGFLFWQKKLSYRQLLPICVALLGLYLLVGGLSNINKGDIITLFTALSYGLYIVYVQNFMRAGDALVLNFQQCLTIAVVSSIVALLTSGSFGIDWTVVGGSILYLSIVATCLAFSLQLVGQKHLPTLTASLILSSEPLFAAFFAWLLGGESLSYYQITGGALIFCALISNEMENRKAIAN